jgi:hypothetical protein
MDSSVSPTHGEQELSVWNGHYATCYHPLFVFNQFGDLERSVLRELRALLGELCQCRLRGAPRSWAGTSTTRAAELRAEQSISVALSAHGNTRSSAGLAITRAAGDDRSGGAVRELPCRD